jgi:DNA-binding NarL/FixJ family response regulator
MSIAVALVEDDLAVRQNLAALINADPGFACVASCASSEEAWQCLPLLAPDVVLMDIHLPGRSGIECIPRLRTLLPRTQVIMLTIEEDSEKVFESMKAGATGYLVKHSSPQEILDAVQAVFRGGAPMSSHIARKVVTAFRLPPARNGEDWPLSLREAEVLRLLAAGRRSKEIAKEMQIAYTTINTYIRNIYEKLHVRSRAEAVARLKGH